MKRSLPPLIACLTVLLAAGLPLGAFTLEPMSLSLAPSGPQSIGSFRLSNGGGERVAVKIEIFARGADLEGRELNEPAPGLFSVYPARLLLAPGETKAFKVQWRGGPAPERELAFRLVAEQVPVEFESGGGSGIKIMFRYIASLYVGGPGLAPELLPLSARGIRDEGGRPGYLVELENRGSRHVIAVDCAFEFRGLGEGGAWLRLEGEALGSLDGLNYLPGLRRRLFIPHESALPGKDYELRLQFASEF